MKKIKKDKTSFEGPFECENCGGHVMLDASFLEQIYDVVKCPYCGYASQVPE
ncbi:MAG: hypothetical protein ACYSW3_24555 [Planctomycetota bacterium]|jgi:DNA-directed RNA polymerase subunit RPC12/RpoP